MDRISDFQSIHMFQIAISDENLLTHEEEGSLRNDSYITIAVSVRAFI
jgi:hypothetical protein